MSAANHIPTMHANVNGPRGEGHSWVVCSCGLTGIPRPTLTEAWDAFYDHLEVETGLPRKPPPSRGKRLPNQSERLFEP